MKIKAEWTNEDSLGIPKTTGDALFTWGNYVGYAIPRCSNFGTIITSDGMYVERLRKASLVPIKLDNTDGETK